MAKEKDLRTLIKGAKEVGCSDSEILEGIEKGNLEVIILSKIDNTDNSNHEKQEDYFAEVTEILDEVGVPANLKGYRYLRTAIVMCVEEPNLIGLVTKALYPAVAKEYVTTNNRVERAIRNAIEVAFKRSSEALHEHFKVINSSKGRATNAEFIAKIADEIRMKHR